MADRSVIPPRATFARAASAPAGRPTPAATNLALGVLLAVAAVGFIALSDVFAKLLAADYATMEIVFYRAVVGGAILAVMFARRRVGGERGRWIARPGLQLLRGLCVLGTVALFFWGLGHVPLANAVAVSVTAPLFMALLGGLILKEPIPPRLWGFMAIGVVGVLLVVRPQAPAGPLWPYLAIIASSVFYALVAVLTRLMAGRDGPIATSLASYVVVIVATGAVLATTGLGPPAPTDLPLVLALGVSGAFGMFVYAYAFVYAGVAELAPWDNAVFLWALLFGLLFFGEIPAPLAVLGGLLVMASGALVTRFGNA